jgi:hypothetical protein
MISDKKIIELWKNPNFSGSYRGIKTFQVLLKTDLDIDVSEKRLFEVLKKEPNYIIHQKPQRNFERRLYDLRNYGELVQADIAYMYDYNGFKYFLLAVDCYSSKVFAIPLKTKDSKVVANAFQEIIKAFQAPIYEIQTDRGKEFLGPCKKLFSSKKILYKTKFGKNKANFAENYIRIVKKKLYMLLRGILNQNWVSYLKVVVDSLNKTPIKKLGWLPPNIVNSEKDSVLIQEAQRAHHIIPYEEPNFVDQRRNQELYEKDKRLLQVNDYVYLDFDEKLFDKSFDIAVSHENFEQNIYFIKYEIEKFAFNIYFHKIFFALFNA